MSSQLPSQETQGETVGFCRKVRFLGKIQKLGVRNSMTYRVPNARKSNFATEPVECIAFLEHVDREMAQHITTIHVVLDHLWMQKGKQVQAWLVKHPRFVFHFPPVH